MESTNYQPLLTFKLSHAYHNDNSLTPVQVTPDMNTQHLFRQMGIRMIQRSENFEIFYSRAFSETISLTFYLTADDPQFYRYTYMGQGALTELDHGTNSLQVTWLPRDTGVQFAVFSIAQNSDADQEAPSNLPINVWGMVQIDVNPENISDSPVVYQIALESLMVYRRYYIISQQKGSSFRIMQNDQEVVGASSFTTKELPNNQQAKVMTLPHTLPLTINEETELMLELLDQANLKIRLPGPNPSSIRFDDDKFYADVYVYV